MITNEVVVCVDCVNAIKTKYTTNKITVGTCSICKKKFGLRLSITYIEENRDIECNTQEGCEHVSIKYICKKGEQCR